jgi:toxin CptA
MPRTATPHTLPRPKPLSALGRGLAAAQLLKETLTIVLLGVPLLLAQPLLAPAAIPGLVLYLFRWVIVLGRIPRRAAMRIWVFTLLDELWGLSLYLNAYDAPTDRQLRYLKWSVGLGLFFTLAALAEIAYRRYHERRGLRRALLGASLR